MYQLLKRKQALRFPTGGLMRHLEIVKKDVVEDLGQESFELYRDICQKITTAFNKLDFAVCSSRFVWKNQNQRHREMTRLFQESKHLLKDAKVKIDRLIELNEERNYES